MKYEERTLSPKIDAPSKCPPLPIHPSIHPSINHASARGLRGHVNVNENVDESVSVNAREQEGVAAHCCCRYCCCCSCCCDEKKRGRTPQMLHRMMQKRRRRKKKKTEQTQVLGLMSFVAKTLRGEEKMHLQSCSHRPREQSKGAK
jgi:hypothetical protein